MIHKFIFNSKNIERSSYFWNAVASSLNASQSVIVLIIVTRTNGLIDAGFFSIAWAIAYLTLTLGHYGMRAYQATDVINSFSIEEYLGSRLVTSSAMVLGGIVYILYGVIALDYSTQKSVIVALVCCWKLIDSIEDVFHGWFQNSGRLDVAAKAQTIRIMVGLIALSFALVLSHNLVVALTICLLFSVFTFGIVTVSQTRYFERSIHVVITKRVGVLLKTCFPLCCVSFLTIYLGNASKYAIDACFGDGMQAEYNFIFMPVFAISLLATFIYFPILPKLAIMWETREIEAIINVIKRQVVFIIAITVVAIVFCYLLGTQILGFIYSTDLSVYRAELCILMSGGGFMAIASLLSVVITTMRNQELLIIGYGIASITALLLSLILVRHFEMAGGVYTYVISSFVLVTCLVFIVFRILNKTRCEMHRERKK